MVKSLEHFCYEERLSTETILPGEEEDQEQSHRCQQICKIRCRGEEDKLFSMVPRVKTRSKVFESSEILDVNKFHIHLLLRISRNRCVWMCKRWLSTQFAWGKINQSINQISRMCFSPENWERLWKLKLCAQPLEVALESKAWK